MKDEILEAKKFVEECKEEIQSELNKLIKGQHLYHSVRGKRVYKGKIVGCRVKCFKEYLQTNTTAIDIETNRNGETLVIPTLVECLYSQDKGFDYFITKEEE
jgi:hypothetical protein